MNYIEKLEELKELTEKAFTLAKEIHDEGLKEDGRFYRLYSESARLRRTTKLALEFEKVDWSPELMQAVRKDIYDKF